MPQPTYDLATIKAEVVRRGRRAFTESSMDGIRALRITAAEVTTIIREIAARDFYKTMPSIARAGEWQDVYRVPGTDRYPDLYVKFTLRPSGAIVISFKER